MAMNIVDFLLYQNIGSKCNRKAMDGKKMKKRGRKEIEFRMKAVVGKPFRKGENQEGEEERERDWIELRVKRENES